MRKLTFRQYLLGRVLWVVVLLATCWIWIPAMIVFCLVIDMVIEPLTCWYERVCNDYANREITRQDKEAYETEQANADRPV